MLVVFFDAFYKKLWVTSKVFGIESGAVIIFFLADGNMFFGVILRFGS